MVLLLFVGFALLGQAPDQPGDVELAAIRAKLSQAPRTLDPDAGIYFKAAEWVLRHPEEFFSRDSYDHTRKVLDAGQTRAAELAAGKPSWVARKGRVARAYRSRIDGSVQPYTVLIPETYDGRTAMRLDVILHGRNARLSEVSFLADAESGKPATAQPDRIELHVFGRTNNAYRWAGETDVFEALASVQERYRIDPERIVLRGFSMGGAGTWHIGLHHPDRWAAIEAGAGFTETSRYAKIENAPGHERRVWPIYDAYLYARNALLVPAVGYGSIDDPQLQASLNVKEQLAREALAPADLRSLFLVGPAIGHRFAPASRKESEDFIAAVLPRRIPDRIRLVTYTARYGRAHWLQIDGLETHYERAEVDATRQDGRLRISTKNISRLILPSAGGLEIDGQAVTPAPAVEKRNGRWQAASNKGLRKRPGLQGPIDDAFMDSFLCVRPSKPHPAAQSRLNEFRANWDKFLRGDIRIKEDDAVTAGDLRDHNLILFGDARTNRLIAKVLPRIPVPRKPAPGELLILIYPNPLNPARYVVLNSGHTFSEKEFRGTNALLYPRLGDWAVLDASGGLVAAGFFDENWR
ncbi:MAG: prolyl oligopeptidase family serine peptidase [Acidobacteria bacterium]|nr:prolyl oligopeptidase family serine peptidase [Acidobacteriota bacterium]